jgi:hypothetical protein
MVAARTRRDPFGEDREIDPSITVIRGQPYGEYGQPELTHHQVAKVTSTDLKIRCQGKVRMREEPGSEKVCNRLLAEQAGRPWIIACPRCKTVNRSQPLITPPTA